MRAPTLSSQYVPGRLTLLSLAVASALAATLPAAYADQTVSTALTTSQAWSSGNFTVTSAGSIVPAMYTALTATGTLGTLNNLGNISSDSVSYIGLYSDGIITELNNSGTLYGGDYGLYNNVTGWDNGTGSIATLINSETGIISSRAIAIYNAATAHIGNFENRGDIEGGLYAISNIDAATVDTLINSGTIRSTGAFGSGSAILSGDNRNTIGSLINTSTGSISGGAGSDGITNGGTITLLSNSGSISGERSGIANFAGTISELNNNQTGSIRGTQFAIRITGGTLGSFNNAGIISGEIRNQTAHNLIINGGSGSTFGVLTGSTTGNGFGIGANNIGLITNTASNVVFGTGNQLLNDHITVGTFAVSNTGTLQVNNALNITGDYTQNASASLLLGVANGAIATGSLVADSGYGRLLVSGSANLATGSTVGLKSLGSYAFAQGQRYVVIQANSVGTDYNASTLTYSVVGYTASGQSVVSGGTDSLLVTIGSAVAGGSSGPGPINHATTRNGTAALSGLFNYGGLDADLMNLFNAGAALGDSSEGNQAGAQLSPTANLSAATQASMASTAQVLNVTTAHIDGLRMAQNGSAGTGLSAGDSLVTSGLWGQAFGGRSRLDERDDMAGYHARYNGMLLGADAMLNDSWRVGGLFSYADTRVNNDGDNDGSSADVKSYGLFGYASYTGSPWYVDLSAGAVEHQYDTQRELDFSGFNSTAKGQHDGMQYIASVQGGYPIELGPQLANLILTPIAGLTYSTLDQDSYTEKGGSGAALHVVADDSTSLKSDLGAKLERTFSTSYGSLTPSAKLTWRHEYHDSGLQSVANYAADTSGATSFTTTGASPVENTGVMALGVTLLRSDNLSLAAKYTLEAGGGYTANTGDVQVRWEF